MTTDANELKASQLPPKQPQLTGADKQLLGYLAIARYLRTDQAITVAYADGSLTHTRNRLLRLAGLYGALRAHRPGATRRPNFAPPFLRRRYYQTLEGRAVEVWALTDDGYRMAERVLGTRVYIPSSDLHKDLLAHSVTLNDVLVGLARRSGVVLAPHRLPFRWVTASDHSRLPWREYDREAGQVMDRVISPDATLELGGPPRRLFLECELGGHSIDGNAHKPGATLAKAERYAKFLSLAPDGKVGSSTFYAAAYPDNLPAEVVFLVPTVGRRDSVNAALGKWAARWPRIVARALTFEDAIAAWGGSAPATSRPTATTAPVAVSRDELKLVATFFNDAMKALKEARDAARAAPGSVLPDYPRSANEVAELLNRSLAPRESGAGATS